MPLSKAYARTAGRPAPGWNARVLLQLCAYAAIQDPCIIIVLF